MTHTKRIVPLLAALLFCLVAPVAARAQTTPEAKKPTDVKVGIYVVQLGDPDLKTGEVEAVFWLWFCWKGDKDLDPMKKFEVVDGQVESRDNEDAEVVGDTYYQAAKVRAKIAQGFDLTRFPLDTHTLEIAVEETSDGVEAIRYTPDAANSKLQETISLSGWKLGQTQATASVKTYASTFGAPSLPQGDSSSYSRVTLSIPISRPGIGYTIKMFWSLYLSVFVALLAFCIKPIDLDPRFGLGVGAVFAAMASAYVISGSLPDGNQVTIADTVVMISIGFIVASIIQSIVSLRIFQAGKETLSATIDKWSFAGFVLAYIAVNALMLRP